jgi:hypothetical protein
MYVSDVLVQAQGDGGINLSSEEHILTKIEKSSRQFGEETEKMASGSISRPVNDDPLSFEDESSAKQSRSPS